MNRLAIEKRILVISALVEGNSLQSTVRMTGVAKNTIVKLLVDIGQACSAYQSASVLRGRTVSRSNSYFPASARRTAAGSTATFRDTRAPINIKSCESVA
jgi:hypothetical protein